MASSSDHTSQLCRGPDGCGVGVNDSSSAPAAGKAPVSCMGETGETTVLSPSGLAVTWDKGMVSWLVAGSSVAAIGALSSQAYSMTGISAEGSSGPASAGSMAAWAGTSGALVSACAWGLLDPSTRSRTP